MLELALEVDVTIRTSRQFLIVVVQFRNLSRSMEYVKNREIQLLEMRTTISDMKNIGTADETLQKEVLVSLKT